MNRRGEKMPKKIEDFGEKIGGARKDIWKERGLIFGDTLDMNDLEKRKYINKNNIWLKPNYEKMVHEQGVPIRVAYFMKRVRDSIMTATPSANEEVCKNYIHFVRSMREAANEVKSDADILDFYKNYVDGHFIHQTGRYTVEAIKGYSNIVTNKFFHTVRYARLEDLDHEIRKKQFMYTDEQKRLASYQIVQFNEKTNVEEDYSGHTQIKVTKFNGALFFHPMTDSVKESITLWEKNTWFFSRNQRIIEGNFKSFEEAKEKALLYEKAREAVTKRDQEQTKRKRKSKFIPPQLEHIERKGEDYRHGLSVSGNDYVNTFSLRAGEFGNWMNQKDRQASLNFGYDALLDMAKALKMAPQDVSLGGTLAVAFGARGHGKALAHYEPLRKVINLTKMKGAGSLAHEWGHALDDYIGTKLGFITAEGCQATQRYYSEAVKTNFPKFNQLMNTMLYREAENGRVKTEFYTSSLAFDGAHSKSDKGYWASSQEMFARAFACYVHDRLEGFNNYLTGHANSGHILCETDNGTKTIYNYPTGEERQCINRAFDEMIDELKEKGLLQEYDYSQVKKEVEKSKTATNDDLELHVDQDGQLCLFDMDTWDEAKENMDALETAVEKLEETKEIDWSKFDFAQKRELKEAMKDNLDVSSYAIPDFEWEQIEQLRLAQKDGCDIQPYCNTKFSWEAIKVYHKWQKENVDISNYVDPKWYPKQLEQIYRGICDGIEPKNVALYAKTEFDENQMFAIREGLLDEKTKAFVHVYADKKYTWRQIEQIRFMIEDHGNEGLKLLLSSLKAMDKPLDWTEMDEIRDGLNYLSVEQVKTYMNKGYNWKQMNVIKEALIAGVDQTFLTENLNKSFSEDKMENIVKQYLKNQTKEKKCDKTL